MLTSVEHLFDMYILFIQYGANLFDAFFKCSTLFLLMEWTSSIFYAFYMCKCTIYMYFFLYLAIELILYSFVLVFVKPYSTLLHIALD